MATYYRTGVETYSIIGTAEEKSSLEGRIPDGSTYFAVDENMFYTFYGGTWYETLPEAARLYHDDVGTDTKPIKLVGGVATVVANELAEDSKVVHNTGDETVAGQKTFLNSPVIQASTPIVNMVSTQAHDASANKAILTVYDQKDNANSAQSQIISKTASNYEQVALRASTPNRQGNYELVNRAFSDHQLVMVTAPYYPVDGSSNPQALDANALMASGNIAVDPRLVHTTGNEEVAGNKVFTGYTFINKPRFKMAEHNLIAGEWRKYYEYTPVSYGGYAIFSIIQTYYPYAWRNSEIRIRQGTPSSNMDGNMYGFNNSLLGCLAKRADGVVEVWFGNPSSSNPVGVRLSIVAEAGGDMIVSQRVGTKPVVGDTYTYVYDMPQN